MVKLTRILTATGLGLTMGLSLLTPAAFAQNASQQVTQQANYTHSIAENWQPRTVHHAFPTPGGNPGRPHHAKNNRHPHNHGHNNPRWHNRGRHNQHPNKRGRHNPHLNNHGPHNHP